MRIRGRFLAVRRTEAVSTNAPNRFVGAAYAGNDLFRSGMGAAFPLFATPMFHTLGLDWGNSLLGFLCVAFLPIPWALWYYGRRIREFIQSHFLCWQHKLMAYRALF